MIKNQTIGIYVEGDPGSNTQTDAENLQYMLLGRGFIWPGGTKFLDLKGSSKWVLYVDIKNKKLSWNPIPGAGGHKPEEHAYYLIQLRSVGLSKTIEIILNPPVFDVIQGCNINQKVRVYDNGNVEFCDGDDYVLTTKPVIEGVAKALGITSSGLPIVAFEYPNSKDYGRPSTRIVRVVKADDEYIQGFQIDNANSKEDGTFKKFLLTKVDDEVRFLKFVQ